MVNVRFPFSFPKMFKNVVVDLNEYSKNAESVFYVTIQASNTGNFLYFCLVGYPKSSIAGAINFSVRKKGIHNYKIARIENLYECYYRAFENDIKTKNFLRFDDKIREKSPCQHKMKFFVLHYFDTLNHKLKSVEITATSLPSARRLAKEYLNKKHIDVTLKELTDSCKAKPDGKCDSKFVGVKKTLIEPSDLKMVQYNGTSHKFLVCCKPHSLSIL